MNSEPDDPLPSPEWVDDLPGVLFCIVLAGILAGMSLTGIFLIYWFH